MTIRKKEVYTAAPEQVFGVLAPKVNNEATGWIQLRSATGEIVFWYRHHEPRGKAVSQEQGQSNVSPRFQDQNLQGQAGRAWGGVRMALQGPGVLRREDRVSPLLPHHPSLEGIIPLNFLSDNL